MDGELKAESERHSLPGNTMKRPMRSISEVRRSGFYVVGDRSGRLKMTPATRHRANLTAMEN
jgi:hypothetical protein